MANFQSQPTIIYYGKGVGVGVDVGTSVGVGVTVGGGNTLVTFEASPSIVPSVEETKHILSPRSICHQTLNPSTGLID